MSTDEPTECAQRDPLFGLMHCTLDKGHEGDHEAWGMTRVLETWPALGAVR